VRLRTAITLVATVAACRGTTIPSGSNATNADPNTGAAPATSIIYRAADGRVITRADLDKASGVVNWEITSKSHVSNAARELHQRGRDAGSSGRYDDALRLLAQAAEAAPSWPYPVYDAAFTCLLKGDQVSALRYYRKTLELAPNGFFTALTAAHYLGLESEHRLPTGTYLAYVSLEWLTSTEERAERIDKIAKRSPGFAPIFKEKALRVEDPAGRLSLLERGLSLDPDPETRGFLLINKAIVLSQLSRKEEAIAILGELATGRSQPLDVQQLAFEAMARLP
jgi:tetratricopeptide (TPR) repeat protein